MERAPVPGTCSRREALLVPATVFGAAAVSSLPHGVQAAPAAALFGESVGLGVKFAQGEPESALESLVDLRVRWVRDAVHWTQLEPEAGRYAPFPSAQQRQFDFYRRHDIGVVAWLTTSNQRAYGRGDERFDPAAFGRFAREAARRLRAQGLRFVIELGNEPHNSPLREHFGGDWAGRPPARWLTHYLRMAGEAVEAVKSLDESIAVLVQDDMWVLHHRFVAAGLPRRLSGFSVHPYTPGPPERTAVEPDTEWARPHVVVDRDRSFASAVRRLREAGAQALGHTPEVWITEWGWPADPKLRGGVAEPLVAAYLPRAFILAAAAGVRGTCWFSSFDSVDGPMGLVAHGGRRRDAYTAFAVMTGRLAGHRLVKRYAARGGLHAYAFERDARPQRRTLVVWSADDRARRLPWPAGAIADGVDGLGRRLGAAEPAADPARAVVTVDGLPKYLPIDEPDPELDARLAALE